MSILAVLGSSFVLFRGVILCRSCILCIGCRFGTRLRSYFSPLPFISLSSSYYYTILATIPYFIVSSHTQVFFTFYPNSGAKPCRYHRCRPGYWKWWIVHYWISASNSLIFKYKPVLLILCIHSLIFESHKKQQPSSQLLNHVLILVIFLIYK